MDFSYEVAIGDTVAMHSGGRWRSEGKVVKIGPKLVHVQDPGGHITQYRRDTQQRNDGYPGYFQTMAQEESRKLRDEAESRLRAVGVELRVGHGPKWPTALLTKLADAAEQIQFEK
jgi:hypothetical protein